MYGVVFKESPFLEGSSKTNLKVLVFELSLQVKVLENFQGPLSFVKHIMWRTCIQNGATRSEITVLLGDRFKSPYFTNDVLYEIIEGVNTFTHMSAVVYNWLIECGTLWLSGVVVNGLALGPRGPGFESRPWRYSTGQIFMITLPPKSSQLQETAVQKGVFGLDRFNGLTGWVFF